MNINPTVGPQAILSFLVFFLYCMLLTLTLLHKGPSSRAKFSLGFYLATAALLNLGDAFASAIAILNNHPPPILNKAFSWAEFALPAVFFLLTIEFLNLSKRRVLWQALGAAWLVMALALHLGPNLPGTLVSALDISELLSDLAVIGWALFMILALLLSMRRRRHTPRPLHRNRIGYWFLALTISVFGDGLSFLGEGLYRQAGSFVKFLAGCFMAYAVLSHHLVDLRYLLRRITCYLVVTLATIAVYGATILALQSAFRDLSAPYSSLISVIAAAIALVILYQPLHSVSQHIVDRLLFGIHPDYVLVLRDYSQNISGVTDLNELAIKAITLIGHAVGAQRGALLIIERKEGNNLLLQVIPGMGPVDAFPLQTSTDHPLIKYLQETRTPLAQYDIDLLAEFQSLSPEDREWLQLLGMDVYIPIAAGEELIGILALGPKSSGNPYRRSDLDFLGTLGDQTALALKNARLFDDLSALNEEIAQLNKELQQLDEAKSSFLTVASHELKTPLTLIQGYANILGSLPQDELQNQAKIKHLTEGITKGTERLRRIVEDMLDIARIDAKTLTLQWKECTLSRLLGLVINQLVPSAQERQQTIEVHDIDKGIPPLDGDPQRLHQAFYNVIENAIKYTPDGGKITVSARLLGGDVPEEQFIEVIIADTGIGIALEDQERIFNSFYRVGDTTLHTSSKVLFKGGGPGLGLAITRGIVEAHSGKIWVESEGCDEERCPGSEFHILLPVRAAKAQEKLQGKDLAAE